MQMSDTAGHPGIGQSVEVAKDIRWIIAPNPSPMTFWGTNSYLIGRTDLAIVDPGPEDPAHLEALLAAVGPGQRISHILVTHSHLDHSPLARPLADRTGAPVLAFGPSEAGRRPVMERLAEAGLAGGGEGIDAAFQPDRRLADGDTVSGPDWMIEAVHTPGHLSNHLCFAVGDVLLTGDHVMGWASSLVSPPDGDLTAFMASCEKLRGRSDKLYLPGHSAPIEDPAARLDWLITHRRAREAQIRNALSSGAQSVRDIARAVYTDTPAALLPAAERNVFAHLIDMVERNLALCDGSLAVDARFRLA
ncbi:MBL fold metallo-hydrolase [Aestuariibius insulae]|uniref:MBL fold metallo-hydrolase n=1 Tax=Aestuariibius insulae TaxID=2058287 RepID=UPI00398F68DF